MLESTFVSGPHSMTQIAIGLIGGIATGKSLAAAFLQALGVEVIDADHIARTLVIPGSAALNAIETHFGKCVLDSNGELNRAALKALIFEDSAQRLWLEQLLHPMIRQNIDKAIEAAKGPYCVVAIPLLKARCDYPKLSKIVMIDIPLALEMERLMQRDQISEGLARTIIKSQPTREKRLALADVVLLNDADPASLKAKIHKLDLEIRREWL